jgi:protein-S-isoprenylcysteine O-methyltransferase Ste14
MAEPVGSRLAAFGVIALFLIAERLLRRGRAARSIQATPDDRGTTRLIGGAYGFALTAGLVSPLLARTVPGRIRAPWVVRSGLSLMVVGLGLRIWAALTLGQYYTRTLRTASDQPVLANGPYAAVRHPGYLGDLLMWIGFGLCSGTWVVATSVPAAMALAYTRRIQAEESMLRRDLGAAYVAYSGRTPRLVPGLW